ncbi:4891_t:CDS:1, partial [Dentiscutata erythropus]
DISHSELLESESSFPIQVSNTKSHKAQIRRKTTKAKKDLLTLLLEHENSLPIHILIIVFDELNKISSDWTYKRIKQYWRNNRKKDDTPK